MRIGITTVLSPIMNRYGDTPLGMVESALEFARIARDNDYHNFIFSMKASNPKVMIEAYRLLARLMQEGPDWNYPIHLGVTEAGDGEDGRSPRSASAPPRRRRWRHHPCFPHRRSVKEIPVAKALVNNIEFSHLPHDPEGQQRGTLSYDPFSYQRRKSKEITGNNTN